MIKADKTVLDETVYIALCVSVMSVFMQAVFAFSGRWNFTVLLGNLWGGILMILNFFFMGLSVQNAVCKEEKDAKKVMKLSHTARTFALFIGLIIGVVVPWFSTLSVIIPFVFPRIAILLRPLWKKG